MPSAADISEIDRVSLPSRSMFAATPVYALDDATLVFGLRQPSLQPANGDTSLIVDDPSSNRLDLISQRLYGNANGWWAIADVSGIIDPFAGVPLGTSLRAPSAQRLPA